METTINNKLIRSFNPCYDPKSIGISDKETLSVKEWIYKYKDLVKSNNDIIWLICRKEFMSDKDLRLFAVWCAKESLKLQKNIDPRSVEACNVAERFANGCATNLELKAAWSAARSARSAAWSAAESAAWSAAWSAAESARSAQIEQLTTYFL